MRRLVPVVVAVLAAAGAFTLRPGAETGACAQDPVVPRVDCDEQSGGGGQSFADQSCTAFRSQFRSVRVRPRGRGLHFSFTRRVDRPVVIDVYQASVRNRVLGEKRVVRLTGRTSPIRWNGRGARDGILYARLQVVDQDGKTDTRRVALKRRGGRFALLPTFFRPFSCATLTVFKLERPVFGGRGLRSLGISFRVAREVRVSVVVRRSGRVVKRFGTRLRRPGVVHRLRLSARGLRPGRYEVRLRLRGDQGTAAASLYAQRL